MSYGLAIGDSGEVYEIGAFNTKRVPTAAETQAVKNKKELEKKKRAHALLVQKQRRAARIAAARKKKAAPKIAANKKKSQANFTLYGENDDAMAREISYQHLGGFIGNGLSGFNEESETVISEFGSGADFGELSPDSGNFGTVKLKRYRHPDFAGTGNDHIGGWWDDITGKTAAKDVGTKDANTAVLLININTAIKAKQDFDKLTADNFAKLQKAPASPEKAALVAKVLKDAQNYNKNTLPKLYDAVNYIAAIPGLEDFAKKLMLQIDLPAAKAQPVVVSLPATLSGDDSMGVAPIVMGIAIGGGMAIAAATAFAGFTKANKAEMAQMQENSKQIDKFLAVISDKNATPEAKTAAAKSIVALTATNKELASKDSVLGNIATITNKLPWILGIGGAAFLFYRFGGVDWVKSLIQNKKAIKPVSEGAK